jgi:hypothetical protein
VLVHKDKKYLAMATTKGIELFPAAKHIKKMQQSSAKVAVRQLKVPFSEAMHKIIADLLHAAVYGCEWERYLPELSLDTSGRAVVMAPGQQLRLPRAGLLPASPGVILSPPASSSAGAPSLRPSTGDGGSTNYTGSTRSDLTPFARDLIRTIVPRVWAALASVPPQIDIELRRAFRTADKNNDGMVCTADVQGILQDFKGAPVSRPDAEAFMRLMNPATPDMISYNDFVATMAKRPLKEIPIEHDIAAIMCGEFVATIYELLGLLPTRTTSMLHTPHPSPAKRRSITSTMSAHTDGTTEIVAGGVGFQGPTTFFPQDAATPGWDSPDGFASAAGIGFTGHVAHSEVVPSVVSPANVRSRHADKALLGAPPHPDLERTRAESLSRTPVPSGWDGRVSPHGSVEGIATSRSRGAAASVASPGGTPGSSTGLPPSGATSRRRGSLDGSLTAKSRIANSSHGSIVVIDTSAGDFRHFTPMSFSSHHVPKLSLLRGRLEPECFIDIPTDEFDAVHAKEMVRSMTAGIRATTMIVPPPDTIGDIVTPVKGARSRPTDTAIDVRVRP